MSRRASVSAAAATLALSLGAFAPIAAGTAHAATCNAAPKSTAPQGQHWYYRTDRSLGRKCWYLAAVGSKGRVAATKPGATPAADEDDEDANAQPAAPMAEAAARLTEPLRSPPPPPPPAADWTIAQATPSAPLAAAPAEPAPPNDSANVSMPQAVATTVPEPAVEPAAAPAVAPPPSAAAAPAPAPERINLMQFVFVAFVALCLLAGLFLYLAAIRRRREIRIVDLNAPVSLRRPEMAALTDSPSVAPEASRRRDGDPDDARLRRFSQEWKRQPA